MNQPRLSFIDWMKCLGMLVIVYGHTAGNYVVRASDPFNPKQLGVAFFVFVMGFSLARETRSTSRTVYNRLFEVYLFALLFAVLQSVLMFLQIGDVNESNYLPLILGVNVVFDSFPANPTTWYIGTYLHLLICWAFVIRGKRVTLWLLAITVFCEIAIRAWLVSHAGNYVAYMALTNWLGVFSLGVWAGQQSDHLGPRSSSRLLFTLALLSFVVLYPSLIQRAHFGEDFPFKRIVVSNAATSLLFTSACVSTLYLSYTWLAFEFTRLLPDPHVVKFFARNTIIIFIAHMPLYYALAPYVHGRIEQGWTRVAINLLIYYCLLAILSELIRRVVQPSRFRDWAWSYIARRSMRRQSATIGRRVEL
jgi:hypothetical protein